ncbi:hypothetical protein Celaphus_00012434, partial [Cervus elaphus hippelaphus]
FGGPHCTECPLGYATSQPNLQHRPRGSPRLSRPKRVTVSVNLPQAARILGVDPAVHLRKQGPDSHNAPCINTALGAAARRCRRVPQETPHAARGVSDGPRVAAMAELAPVRLPVLSRTVLSASAFAPASSPRNFSEACFMFFDLLPSRPVFVAP